MPSLCKIHQQHPLLARHLLPPLQQEAQACKQTASQLYRAGAASKHLPAASAAAYDAIQSRQDLTSNTSQLYWGRGQNHSNPALAASPGQGVLARDQPRVQWDSLKVASVVQPDHQNPCVLGIAPAAVGRCTRSPGYNQQACAAGTQLSPCLTTSSAACGRQQQL
jgi:hypothetical protein